jgi:cell division cycle protein 37
MLLFAQSKDFEQAYKFIQDHPQIVSRTTSDHLMARAFRLQMEGSPKEARQCCQWSLALNYSMQMGSDGVGLFFKKYVR